ncbi:hypothetical protein [Variovorax soli]|uniref:Lipoprotein n=1 Tax=Variovorax soli TaxID=376815 RepID=A0ABU1NJ44_9BURK|nr:hypothetical protein [Variovorax soli]MDR6538475.1 hypothetical protein [Variovorax soli]
MKKLLLIASCGLLFGCSWSDRSASSEVKKEMWCALNSSATAVGSEGPYVKIESGDIHIASKKLQAATQQLLKSRDFLEIPQAMAKTLAPSLGDRKREGLYYYLVRAAALYDESSESLDDLQFNVVYFPHTKTLNVYFFGLGAEATPKNLALLIAIKHHISKVNSLCEIAA